MTGPQASNIKKIDNIVSNNAKPHDFKGVAKELRGESTGFDHVTEMKNSVKGLDSAAKGLRGSLNNPNLSAGQRAKMEISLEKAESTALKMKETLRGGIQ